MKMFNHKTKPNTAIVHSPKNDTETPAKYVTVYYCPLCGALIPDSEAQEVRYEDLPKLIDRVVKNQQFAGNPYLYEASMYKKHFCNDGSVGLAFFAGFMKIK